MQTHFTGLRQQTTTSVKAVKNIRISEAVEQCWTACVSLFKTLQFFFPTTFSVRLDIAIVSTSAKYNIKGEDVWNISCVISYETTAKMGT